MRFVAIFVFAIVVGVFAAPVSSQVQISEILADPASDWDGDGEIGSKPDEWVEIVNTGSTSVDLSTFGLTDGSGGAVWRFGFSGVLQPGAVAVVYGSEAVEWQSVNGFPSLGLSLNNGGDTVFLFDTATGDTTTVDEYTYDSFAVVDDRAVGRADDGTWVVFDALNPYSGSTPPLGSGCAPTPGAVNECLPSVPVEESTWGKVKKLFSQ